MCTQVKYLFGFAVKSTDACSPSLIILRLILGKTLRGLAAHGNRVPTMAQGRHLEMALLTYFLLSQCQVLFRF